MNAQYVGANNGNDKMHIQSSIGKCRYKKDVLCQAHEV
jgi:hypothetical protein